jgi:hypothetical protein
MGLITDLHMTQAQHDYVIVLGDQLSKVVKLLQEDCGFILRVLD